MIQLQKSEIEELEYIGSGTFGTVYKKDDKIAYKLYHPIVADDNGRGLPNPTLSLSKRRFKRLIEASKNLQYSGGILDTIYIDGNFSGVAIPYYAGKKLTAYLKSPLSTKIKYAKQMVRNSEELSNHHIYPTDYKLNNIIVTNDELKMIDLDDKRTHICLLPNPILYSITTDGLFETLWSFFDDCSHCYVPNSAKKYIKAPDDKYITTTHQQIRKYIAEKERPRNLLFIDKNTDLARTREFLDHVPADVIYSIDFEDYTYPAEEEYLSGVMACKEKAIPIYDFSQKSKNTNYSSYVTTMDEYCIEKDQVKQLKKTK